MNLKEMLNGIHYYIKKEEIPNYITKEKRFGMFSTKDQPKNGTWVNYRIHSRQAVSEVIPLLEVHGLLDCKLQDVRYEIFVNGEKIDKFVPQYQNNNRFRAGEQIYKEVAEMYKQQELEIEKRKAAATQAEIDKVKERVAYVPLQQALKNVIR
ncbi:MAG: hypothetical protein J5608_01320 [Alphaproteobacteria bacterium]|nr:hypothetical protein [Alphaproteobacteria bacterium]